MSSTPKNQHRAKFVAIRASLQQHDPFKLMERFGGDRFDAELYGYEANSLLEAIRNGADQNAIAVWLQSQASSKNMDLSSESLATASGELWTVLKSF